MVPAAGLFLLYLTGMRQSGPETLGEPIYWNYVRPYHAALLLTVAGLTRRMSALHCTWMLHWPLQSDQGTRQCGQG